MKSLYQVRAYSFLLLAVLLAANPAFAQAPAEGVPPGPAEVLYEASIIQKEIVSRLANAITDVDVVLSDGAVLEALENLIREEQAVMVKLREIFPMTIGRRAQNLSTELAGALQEIVQHQQTCSETYAGLHRTIGRKVLARMDSVFSTIAFRAEGASLSRRMEALPILIGENQISLSLEELTEIVDVLRSMADLLGGRGESDKNKPEAGPQGFAPPSLLNTLIPFSFPWSGDSADILGEIFRLVQMMEDLAKRQETLANQVRSHVDPNIAPASIRLASMAEEQSVIRFYSNYVAEGIMLMDPPTQLLILGAVTTMDEEAIPALQREDLVAAQVPTRRVAEQLQKAAESLKATWDDILDRLSNYTSDTAIENSMAMGIPHGMSKEEYEAKLRAAQSLLRATRAMGLALELQNQIITDTGTAQAESSGNIAWDDLVTRQQGIESYLGHEVLPFALYPGAGEEMYLAAQRIQDATESQRTAIGFLESAQASDAIRNETEAHGHMKLAMGDLIRHLQFLLGQLSPQAQGADTQGRMGMVVRANAGGTVTSDWAWNLPPQRRNEITQAFRGDFPEKYRRLIRLYFEDVAGVEEN